MYSTENEKHKAEKFSYDKQTGPACVGEDDAQWRSSIQKSDKTSKIGKNGYKAISQ